MGSYLGLVILGLSLMFVSPALAGKKGDSLFYDGEFKGPFEGTSIVRFYDPKYNVVCYMYIPKFVSTQLTVTQTGSGVAFKSFAGNISCVKVGR